jgi:site-specific recombinase XerD
MTHIDPTNGRLCLPVLQWPAGDQRLWAALQQAPSSPFVPASVAAMWSPRRRRIVEQGYGQWLAWLAANGLLDADVLPEDRVTSERMTRFVTQLVERVAPVSAAMMVGALVRMLAVLSPETDWAWMRRLYQDLKGWAEPARDKRAAVVPAKDLFDLGINLMDTTEAKDRDPYFAATQYRDGLLIAMLIARPLRMCNISSIQLGRHLVRDGDGYWLRFPAKETKTRVEIDVPVPGALTERLETYLTTHRIVLVDRREKGTPKTQALWVSRWGTAMIEHAVRDQIKKRTLGAFRHAVWPHLFRDCAATSLAVEDPENARLAAGLLGHNTFATTEKHYILAQTLQAGRQYQQVVQILRDATADQGDE